MIMATGEFGAEVRLTAKRLLRQVLAVHLGDAPLKSRDLFRNAGAGEGGTAGNGTPAAAEKVSKR